MTITLPPAPSANRYWRNFRGRMVVSAEARAYKESAAWLAKAAGMEPITGDVSVTLRVYRQAKRGDLDNSIKVSLDSLIGVAYADDSQIVRIVAERYDDKRNPRVEVEVTPA
jgi:Holliday junction resolvase RusA-like endonuclease